MKRWFRAERRVTAQPCRWLRRAGHGVLWLALAFPGVAQPCSLEQLLRTPLEQLLELKFSAQPAPAASHRDASAIWRPPGDARAP